MKVITIGSGQENDYVINNSEVSRHHTQLIMSDDGSFSVIDMGSVNGTYVNGIRVLGEMSLSPSDVLTIANIDINWKLIFEENATFGKQSSRHKKKDGVYYFLFGAVSMALVVGVVYAMLIYINNNKDAAEKKEAIEKEILDHIELQQFDSKIKEVEYNAFNDSLGTIEDEILEKKTQQETLSDLNKVKVGLLRKTVEIRTNKKLSESINRIRQVFNGQAARNEELLKEEIEKNLALKSELRAEQERVDKLKADYDFVLDNIKVYAALEYVDCKAVCDCMYIDCGDAEPKELLYEMIKEGKGDTILYVIEILSGLQHNY